MPTFRLLAAIVVAVVIAFVPTPVQADTAETKLFYWPSSSALTGSGTWSSSMIGVDFRDTFASHWGMHVQYAIGNQSGFGGGFAAAGANAGTDTVYSAEFVHEWQLSTLTLRASGGYGSLTLGGPFVSVGYRVPLPCRPGRRHRRRRRGDNHRRDPEV